MHRFPPPKLEKATFLGIAARPATEELRAQFKLPAGTALLVDRVADDSPAAKAGIKQFDVLTKVDDQLIINPEQLAVLIRMHKANDEVKLSIIHEAAATTIAVTLVEKDLPPLEGPRPPGPGGPGGPDGDREHGHRGLGPMMGRIGGFMFGMMHRRGMHDGMGMHRGMEGRDPGPGGPEGMHDGKGLPGGPDGMREGPGGPLGMGMFGLWGMHGPRGEMGMRRGMEGRDPGPGGPEGMHDGKGLPGGPDGMREGRGGPPGMWMFGRWGMHGPRGEMGMRRGPEGDDDGPDGPPHDGPRGPHGDHGDPATQPAHPGAANP
jgi:hypothetical protein